jgi:hypothetical protein
MIKKHASRNEYTYAGSGLWVRNLTKKFVKPIDINEQLVREFEIPLLLANEAENAVHDYRRQLPEETFKKIAIVSDGDMFESCHKLLEQINKDVCIIGICGTLKNWDCHRRMNFYIVNNPFNEAIDYLPKIQKTNPRCIASSRTNPKFLEKFPGIIYEYTPTPNRILGSTRTDSPILDDYRSPLCAALSFSYHLGVEKLAILFPDTVYNNHRPGSIRVSDGFVYPQSLVARNLADAVLGWLKKPTAINSSLPYQNARLLECEKIINYLNA